MGLLRFAFIWQTRQRQNAITRSQVQTKAAKTIGLQANVVQL